MSCKPIKTKNNLSWQRVQSWCLICLNRSFELGHTFQSLVFLFHAYQNNLLFNGLLPKHSVIFASASDSSLISSAIFTWFDTNTKLVGVVLIRRHDLLENGLTPRSSRRRPTRARCVGRRMCNVSRGRTTDFEKSENNIKKNVAVNLVERFLNCLITFPL